MGLRERAALDCQRILEDTAGFGWPLTLKSPAGVVAALVGLTTDVSTVIDPETGIAVSGRKASVAIALRSLTVLPEPVADGAMKPWLVTFDSITGTPSTWKVIEALPDRAVGIVVLMLEVYAGAD